MVECVDGVVLEHVRVDPLGDDWVVTYDPGYCDDWDSGGEEHADRCVAAVMQPDPSKAGTFCDLLEVGAVGVWVDGGHPGGTCDGQNVRTRGGSRGVAVKARPQVLSQVSN